MTRSFRRHITWKRLRLMALVLLLLVAGFALVLDFRVRDAFEGKRFALPARLYARALELFPGEKLGPETLVTELKRLEYAEHDTPDQPGQYHRRGDSVELVTRPFHFWDGEQATRRVRVLFRREHVTDIVDAQEVPITLVRLDPVYIGGIYPAHNEDRLLVRLQQVPPELTQALFAIEDRKYREHIGIDPRGMARAVATLLTGRGVQGGSTLTQQLVKNFFLSPERTLTRKATEILMAVLLELHYSKDEILETYLNEIYLGQDGNRAIHGVGLAAQFYFGKRVEDLTLAESALLVGMIKGPSVFHPRKHPERARARRDLVLAEMARLELAEPAAAAAARTASLGVIERPPVGTTPYPAFLDLVRRQLRRDYAEADLRSEGLRLFTTLDPVVQSAAEQVLASQLARLDRQRKATVPLEGAVVVSDVQSGEVQALVGGRDPRFEGFNRALDALRPVGSLLKPAIYLTALAEPARYTLVTPLDDGPLLWKERGAPDWSPENYDRQHHGQVPLRQALAQSYNVASARLGLELGVNAVHETIHRLGVARELPPYASSLLGAVELAPLEVAQMYQTLAAGGFRTPLRAIREVTTAEGKPLRRYGLSVEQAFDAAPVYLLTSALQDVVREGTGAGLRNSLPAALNLAGKTGTTDELRDAWFAGYSGDRVAVVWVGHDDNTPAGLTGAAGALPVWGELMRRLNPEPLAPPLPDGVERVWIDPASGWRADRDCAGAIELPFWRDSAPEETAPCAASTSRKIKNWFRRLFE
ncbi:MAG TPA: penicillin-binding protein 1B [Gammaproteobacteria bacterium]|nr:penicillin-binding protein 1B [Gammaproteobacteria bacterium]